MHGYWNSSYSEGWMVVHGAFWIIILAALVIGTVYLLRSSRREGNERAGQTPLEILDRRYAEGEIDREEYLQRKQDVLDGQPDAPRKRTRGNRDE